MLAFQVSFSLVKKQPDQNLKYTDSEAESECSG